METKNCPVCASPLSGSFVCARCGYNARTDYTLLRSLARPSDADGELLRLRRENARQRLELEELREELRVRPLAVPGPVTEEAPPEADGILRPINSFY